MNLKQALEKFLRHRVASRFSRVQEFEKQKFISETAGIIAAEADAREMNEQDRHYLLYRIQRQLLPKFVIADHGRVILDDEAFRSVFTRFSDDNWTSFERKWNLRELLKLTIGIEGDYAECGVYRGGSSWFLCEAAADQRQVHLFDSFEGLSKPRAHEDFHWQTGDLAVSEEQVLSNLSPFENFQTYRGWIPERFAEVADRKFSFVHIDVDLEQPTRDSIEFFYPRLSTGGVIVLDDHGSAMCPGARSAALEYFAQQGEQVIDLATGQGLMIRRN